MSAASPLPTAAPCTPASSPRTTKKRTAEGTDTSAKSTSTPAKPRTCFHCYTKNNVSVLFYCEDDSDGEENEVTFCAKCAENTDNTTCIHCEKPFELEKRDAVFLMNVVRRTRMSDPTESTVDSDLCGYYHRACITKSDTNDLFHCRVSNCELTTWDQSLGEFLFSLHCPGGACDSCHDDLGTCGCEFCEDCGENDAVCECERCERCTHTIASCACDDCIICCMDIADCVCAKADDDDDEDKSSSDPVYVD
jgi:hypothetical protein